MPIKLLVPLNFAASAGAGGAVVGAFSHQDMMTWSGVAIAVTSAMITAAMAGYHKIREAARQEDIADRQAQEEAIKRQLRAQVELEERLKWNSEKLEIMEKSVLELVERVKRERCPFAEEGHAKCDVDDDSIPPKVQNEKRDNQ